MDNLRFIRLGTVTRTEWLSALQERGLLRPAVPQSGLNAPSPGLPCLRGTEGEGTAVSRLKVGAVPRTTRPSG